MDASMFDSVMAGISGWLALYGLKLLGAVLILLLGMIAARRLTAWAQKLMRRAKMEETLITFGGSLLRFLLGAFVIIAALNQLGFQTASLIAILGAASLAVGLALQSNLSNLAAGVLILLFKPFKLGNVIETSGSTGTVHGINILTTTLKCADGRMVTVPNNKLFSDKVINYSVQKTMRADIVVGIGYEDDIPRAREVIKDILENYPNALKEPAPQILVVELGDNSVNIAIRTHVNKKHYWSAKSDLMEAVKLRFDREGINIPYPQRDVHLIPQEPPQAA